MCKTDNIPVIKAIHPGRETKENDNFRLYKVLWEKFTGYIDRASIAFTRCWKGIDYYI